MKNKPIGIILTDTHLHKDNTEEVVDIFTQAIELAKEYEVERVFHMGDVFDSRSAQTLRVLSTFGSILDMFEESGINLIAIPGNHDKASYTSYDSFLDPFEDHPNFILNIDGYMIQDKNINIGLIPFFDTEMYKDRLDELVTNYKHKLTLKNSINVLLTHIAINGVKNNDGTVIDDGIPVDEFRYFDSVLVGHYHNQSKVGNNVYYVGSAMPKNYGEDNDKGFTILYDDGSHKFIKGEFKEFHTKEVSFDFKADDINEWYDQNKVHNKRLIIKGPKAKLDALDLGSLMQMGIDIKTSADEVVESIQDASEGKVVSFTKESLKEAFDEFCEENDIIGESKEIGDKYLKQVTNG